jgi:hypothetical protein
MRILRFGTLLMVIGLSIVALAAFPPRIGMGGGGPLEPGGYQGGLYMFTSSVHMTIEVRDNLTISLYLLDWDDTLTLLQTGSLDHTSPHIAYHNITSFNGIIEVPAPGMYSLIADSTHNETVFLDIDMYTIQPQTHILAPGLVFICLGASIIILRKLYTKYTAGQ